MNNSKAPIAWIVWAVLLMLFLMASMWKDSGMIFVTGFLLFPLTGFLLIRGVIRWTGKQWRHGSAQGQ